MLEFSLGTFVALEFFSKMKIALLFKLKYIIQADLEV
jgi:hypothetical protein